METRANLRRLLGQVRRGRRFVITERSKPRAVLLSPEEVETLEIMADRKTLQELVEAKADIKAGRYATYEAFFGKPRAR
jgi:prevent-host-death family protein